MKVKKLNLSRTDFPVVTSLDNLEVGRIYTTHNPKIIKPLPHNRGKLAGYVPERVNALQKKLDAGKFYMNVPHVLVNLAGYAIDGNNRLKMLSNNGLPVNFMITAQPEFNCADPSEILNNVSEYNTVNTKWTGDDAYTSALAYKELAALAIDNWHTKISNGDFTPSRMIALATKDKGGLAGKNQPRRAYCNEETANVLNSDEFEATINFIVEVMNFVKQNNPSITEWFVIRCLMPMIWKHELSFNIVLKNLKKVGFKNMSNTKMVGVRSRVNEILKKGNL